MKSGIYSIKDTINNRIYIGQSVNVKIRLISHKSNLKAGKHKNVYLQRSYDKCNGEGFEFEVIEYCSIDELDEREKYWIEKYQSNHRDKGYNIQSGGHDGHTWNDEAKAARRGSGNPMYGHHHSDEFVKRIRMINRASSDKLTVDDVDHIKQSLANGITQTELAKKYDVTISTINKISRCDNWDWVRPDLNEKIKNLEQEKKQSRNELMREMYMNGATATDIAKKLGCNPTTVANVLKDLVDGRKAARQDLKRNVERDFLAGISKEEIMKKYDISSSSYVRYTTKALNDNKQKLIDEVIKRREAGMMVKDIAAELGLHRTTVTDYCKKYGSR